MPVLSAREMEGVSLPAPGSADYWEDSKWASENFTEIVKKYPNLYVAIVGKRVVAAAKTIAESVWKSWMLRNGTHWPISLILLRKILSSKKQW